MDNIANWMYHFTSSVETAAEEKHSISKLNNYISESMASGVVSKDLGNRTRLFLTNSFYTRLSRLCFRHFMSITEGDRADNSWTESQNSALKRDVSGPKPFHKISGRLLYAAYAAPNLPLLFSHPLLS